MSKRAFLAYHEIRISHDHIRSVQVANHQSSQTKNVDVAKRLLFFNSRFSLKKQMDVHRFGDLCVANELLLFSQTGTEVAPSSEKLTVSVVAAAVTPTLAAELSV